MTLDAIARELGCTLYDLERMNPELAPAHPTTMIDHDTADQLRAVAAKYL